MASDVKKKQDGFLVLSKRITILRQELRQKEDQVEQLQGHVLWLETEFKKKQSDSRDEMTSSTTTKRCESSH